MFLKLVGFDPTVSAKLVRRQDRRHTVQELRRYGQAELYRVYHGKRKFHRVKQIVSFYGLLPERTRSQGLVLT